MDETMMNYVVKYGIEHIDWVALCDIFRRAPSGVREPEKLKIAAGNSHTVCSAYVDQKIIGFVRLKTGMGLFPDLAMYRASGYLD